MFENTPKQKKLVRYYRKVKKNVCSFHPIIYYIDRVCSRQGLSKHKETINKESNIDRMSVEIYKSIKFNKLCICILALQ
jgi:hypothetical protein